MFGRTLLNTNSILQTRVSADNSPQYKPGGITIDWSTVVAPGADVNVADGSVVRSGNKFLRYGQIMCAITLAGTDVITMTATGGTFTISVTSGGTTQTTPAQAFNVATATLQTALQALSNVGAGNATVTGTAGTTYNIVFATALGPTTITLGVGSLTGGTATNAQTSDNAVGYYGPYDPAAGDGRQTLARGQCYILDELVLQYDISSGLNTANDQTGRVFDAGLVWIDRVLQSGVATHTLAAGPTLAEFLAAFPAIRPDARTL